MKIFLLGFLLSFLAMAKSYAISFPDRNSFTAVSKVSSGSLEASTSSFNLQWGDQIFVHVAKDNLSSADGETNEVMSVVDSLGNTYKKIKEYSNGQGKKLAGVVTAIFLATNVNETPLVDEPFTVTVQFSTANVVAKAVAVQRVISDHPLEVVKSAVLANDNANPGPMDLNLSSEPYGEYLWVRTMALEGDWVNFFETPSYADWGTDGTTGGGTASNISVAYEADVSTGTSNRSDPVAINVDSVSILVAFREKSVP
jgi:hypothetical protein